MKVNLSTKKIKKGSQKETKKTGDGLGRLLFLFTIVLILILMVFMIVKYIFWGKEIPMTMSEVQQAYSYENVLPKQIGDSEAYAGLEVTNDIYQAQKAYEDGQYQLAIKHFNKSVTTYPKRFDLKLYTALTNLHLGKDDRAQQLFYEIINHQDKSLYANEALWYSALIDLKNNNIVNCKESVESLIEMNTNTKEVLEKAVELQDRLERL